MWLSLSFRKIDIVKPCGSGQFLGLRIVRYWGVFSYFDGSFIIKGNLDQNIVSTILQLSTILTSVILGFYCNLSVLGTDGHMTILSLQLAMWPSSPFIKLISCISKIRPHFSIGSLAIYLLILDFHSLTTGGAHLRIKITGFIK